MVGVATKGAEVVKVRVAVREWDEGVEGVGVVVVAMGAGAGVGGLDVFLLAGTQGQKLEPTSSNGGPKLHGEFRERYQRRNR